MMLMIRLSQIISRNGGVTMGLECLIAQVAPIQIISNLIDQATKMSRLSQVMAQESILQTLRIVNS